MLVKNCGHGNAKENLIPQIGRMLENSSSRKNRRFVSILELDRSSVVSFVSIWSLYVSSITII